MNAFGGATVHGFLNLVGIGAALVNNYGITLFLIQFEYFRADFFTGITGDALGVDDVGNPYDTHRFLLEVSTISKKIEPHTDRIMCLLL
jgi:hypothetical protein